MLDALIAALTFFTRLPFWRLRRVERVAFRHIVPFWPVAGWFIAACTAAVLWLAGQVLPVGVSVALALAARTLLTGALHEDGLSDFFDGFGGGTSRERTLAIMKDSRTGSYAVLGLVLYYLVLWSTLSALPLEGALAAVAAGDPLCRAIAAQLINLLPYARTEAESKGGAVYARMSPAELVLSVVAGIAPALLLLAGDYRQAAVAPLLVFWGLVVLMRRRIGGYTGDCCGAAFLLCEVSFYVAFKALYIG